MQDQTSTCQHCRKNQGKQETSKKKCRRWQSLEACFTEQIDIFFPRIMFHLVIPQWHLSILNRKGKHDKETTERFRSLQITERLRVGDTNSQYVFSGVRTARIWDFPEDDYGYVWDRFEIKSIQQLNSYSDYSHLVSYTSMASMRSLWLTRMDQAVPSFSNVTAISKPEIFCKFSFLQAFLSRAPLSKGTSHDLLLLLFSFFFVAWLVWKMFLASTKYCSWERCSKLLSPEK